MPDQTPDPLARGLRSLASSAAQSAHGPDPAEIRARGTQRHRRRVGAVAALSTVAIVTAGTVAFGASSDLGTEPAPPVASSPQSSVPTTTTLEPEGGWLKELPASFVIDADVPPDGSVRVIQGPEEGLGVPDVEICGTPAFADAPPAVEGLVLSSPAQYRGVMLYPDEADARTALYSVTDRAAACPRETSPDSFGESGWTVESLDERPATTAVLAHTLPEEVTAYYFLVQRGNALAVVNTALQNAGADMIGAVERARQQSEEAMAGLSVQMCVFTTVGCDVEEPEPVDAPLSSENLPTGEELPGYGELTGWRTTSTAPGDGQSTVSVCQQSSLAGLGAVDVWKRDYDRTNTYPPGTTPDPDAAPGHTGISIAQFDGPAAAQDAYAEVLSWIERCEGDGRKLTPLGPVTAAGGSGETFLLFYPVPGSDLSVIDGQAVGLVGSRIVLIAQTSQGMDYNYEPGQSPIAGALGAALIRLAGGVNTG